MGGARAHARRRAPQRIRRAHRGSGGTGLVRTSLARTGLARTADVTRIGLAHTGLVRRATGIARTAGVVCIADIAGATVAGSWCDHGLGGASGRPARRARQTAPLATAGHATT
jgi:hypothetical protein